MIAMCSCWRSACIPAVHEVLLLLEPVLIEQPATALMHPEGHVIPTSSWHAGWNGMSFSVE